jgi:hypothetical protein
MTSIKFRVLTRCFEENGSYYWTAITAEGSIVRVMSGTPQPRLVLGTHVCVSEYSMKVASKEEGLVTIHLLNLKRT